MPSASPGTTDDVELLGPSALTQSAGEPSTAAYPPPSKRASVHAYLRCGVFFIALSVSLTISWVMFHPDSADSACELDDADDDNSTVRRRLQGGREVWPSSQTFTNVPWSSVNRVVDGDTICVTHRPAFAVPTLLRLVCIDAPELRPLEPHGLEARDALEGQLRRAGSFSIVQYGVDGTSSRRPLVALMTPESRNINLLLVEQGDAPFACFRGACGDTCDIAAFTAAEQQARAAGRGVWAV